MLITAGIFTGEGGCSVHTKISWIIYPTIIAIPIRNLNHMNPFNLKGFFFEDLNFQAIDKKATGEMDKIWDKEQLEL